MDVAGKLEQIDELLREVNDADLTVLTDAELHDAAIRSEKQTAAHTAARARLVRAWDTSKAWADNGSLSPSARLVSATGCAASTASAECRRGRKLTLMPIAAAALAAGEISVDTFDALARCNTGRFRDLFADAEATLVDIAKTCRFSELHQRLVHWRLTADALVPGSRDRKQDEDRRLHASRTFDGTVVVNGVCTPLGGEIFLNELERLTRDLYAEDRAEAKERLGRMPHADELRRDHAQRRHDALVEMATRSAAMPADARKPAPDAKSTTSSRGPPAARPPKPTAASTATPTTEPATNPTTPARAPQI